MHIIYIGLATSILDGRAKRFILNFKLDSNKKTKNNIVIGVFSCLQKLEKKVEDLLKTHNKKRNNVYTVYEYYGIHLSRKSNFNTKMYS